MTRPLPRRSTLLIALVIVVVDQLSQAAASSALREGQSLPLLPYLLGHYYRSQIFGAVHSCCKEVQTGLQ